MKNSSTRSYRRKFVKNLVTEKRKKICKPNNRNLNRG